MLYCLGLCYVVLSSGVLCWFV